MKANKGSKISFQKTCTRTNECSNIVCNEPKTNQNHLCIIVFSTHSRVRMKAIFKKKNFLIQQCPVKEIHTQHHQMIWWQIHICMCSNCTLRACNNGWTFWICRCKAAACKPWAVTSPQIHLGDSGQPRSVWDRGIGGGPPHVRFLFY